MRGAGARAVAAESPRRRRLPAANVPTPASLGRPLDAQGKAGRGSRRAGLRRAAARRARRRRRPRRAAAAAVDESAGGRSSPRPCPPPAKPLGRPMTLQEKLAAARGGAAQPRPRAGGAAKPAAAKPAAAAAAKTAGARVLPPLEKMTDPKDLAEAARQAAAKKAKELAAKRPRPLPRQGRPGQGRPGQAADRSAQADPRARRRRCDRAGRVKPPRLLHRQPVRLRGASPGSSSAWVTFTAALSAMTLMCVRFMFPNVLAEPPSTIKVGLPTNYEPEEVSERFKAEWGFWIVRSTRYNGQDILYALQSVCTHLGCPPNWLAAEQKFKCPCHGSGFYISGINFEGPAPRPLERFKVALADDGQIMVDKSQKFQQELGQWSDPDSFIPA